VVVSLDILQSFLVMLVWRRELGGGQHDPLTIEAVVLARSVRFHCASAPVWSAYHGVLLGVWPR